MMKEKHCLRDQKIILTSVRTEIAAKSEALTLPRFMPFERSGLLINTVVYCSTSVTQCSLIAVLVWV